jgi:glucosamine--fructose-6-phosphate aminotransferase (isomerizing)
MCGIVAVYGRTSAPDDVISGLKNLEYRGYDSWGVGAPGENEITIQKETGKISKAVLDENFPKASMAIGHTRWATHGNVTAANAHPHFCENKKIAVVHNGIIENYVELRNELQARNHKFASDTDTEVLCHLLKEFLDAGETLREAARKTSDRCEGRFAFVVLHHGEDRLVGVRSGSPLILGLNDEKNEYFIASDTPAFLEHTQKVHYIDDGEVVEITKEGAKVFLLNTDKEIVKRDVILEASPEDASKGDHAHFMIKEIYEQKETIARAINQDPEEMEKIAEEIRRASGTFLIGCGTAHKVAAAGEYFFAKVARRHINTVVASEFPIFHDFLRPESLVIAISQSGETADVIEAIEAAREAGSEVLSIVNSVGSTVARMSDFSLHIKAGPEKAVASTKAATSQLAVLLLLAYACGRKIDQGRKVLAEAAAQVNDMLNIRFVEFVEGIAKKIAKQENIFIIGKGANFPMANEAAIKIQEVSYIHAEGFAGGELKHGPIAMIDEGTPCLVLVSDDEDQKREILSNAMEIKARGGHIIGIAPENSEVFDDWIRVPAGGIASAILNLIPVQVLSYFLALERGFDPDQPRNLAKSVTVK